MPGSHFRGNLNGGFSNIRGACLGVPFMCNAGGAPFSSEIVIWDLIHNYLIMILRGRLYYPEYPYNMSLVPAYPYDVSLKPRFKETYKSEAKAGASIGQPQKETTGFRVQGFRFEVYWLMLLDAPEKLKYS